MHVMMTEAVGDVFGQMALRFVMAGLKYLIQLMGGLYHSVISIHIHVTVHLCEAQKIFIRRGRKRKRVLM